MPQSSTTAAEPILDARARMPANVVYRSFVTETVILNLNTGKYFGVNLTGGRMIELLEQSNTVREAAATLAAECGEALEGIEQDLCEFCTDLAAQELLHLNGNGNGHR